ncbi:hypothetical protein ACFORO_12505 [Amycolatopsis halotolerans]|uniref:Uncharacterized protein n=1 Tax=Amycolatopsis halotolerans TaxID=330083 RepID=A0ABV7QFN7_9PSEU
MTNLEPRIVHIDDEQLVDWVSDPVFDFKTEVDALRMLQALSENLRSAREQVKHSMRYLSAAVKAAGQFEEDGERIRPQAIIRESGLARQTVYDLLNEKN